MRADSTLIRFRDACHSTLMWCKGSPLWLGMMGGPHQAARQLRDAVHCECLVACAGLLWCS